MITLQRFKAARILSRALDIAEEALNKLTALEGEYLQGNINENRARREGRPLVKTVDKYRCVAFRIHNAYSVEGEGDRYSEIFERLDYFIKFIG